MTKYKAIKVDPRGLLKALPKEFWLKVPVWSERYRDNWLTGPLTSGPVKLSSAAKEFPEYREFYKKVLDGEFYGLEYSRDFFFQRGRDPRKTREDCATRDWVELSYGKNLSFRYVVGSQGQDCEPHVEFKHVDLGDEWYDHRGVYSAAEEAGLNGYEFGQKLDKAQKRLHSLWNKLRREARREAGLDLPPEEAKAKAKKEREVRVTKARMAALLHIDKLVENLLSYKKLVEGDVDSVTVARVREVFEDTNEMTSVNAELKQALGVQ